MGSETFEGKSLSLLKLLRPLPFWLRFDVLPWVVGYPVCLGWLVMEWEGGSDLDLLRLSILALAVLSHALMFLLCYWLVGLQALVRYKNVGLPTSSSVPTHAYCVPAQRRGPSAIVPIIPKGGALWFSFQERKYVSEPDSESPLFHKLEYKNKLLLTDYVSSPGYRSQAEVTEAREKWGHNKISIPSPNFWTLYIEQTLSPFFVFQVFCVLLWCMDDYWYYSLFTLFMLLIFEGTVVKFRMKNLQQLREMLRPPTVMAVQREGKWNMISSDDLLPGDICLLSSRTSPLCPADMLLLSGQVVVNESLLTGESTPQVKEAIMVEDSDEKLSMKQHQSHILYGGTTIMQHSVPQNGQSSSKKGSTAVSASGGGGGCLAYVLRTGYETSQGKLMRTIMYSARRVTENSREVGLFIFVLLCFALVAAAYVMIEGLKDPNRSRKKLLLECTLVLTSVVPPELPMELSLAVNTSLLRLIKKDIFCTEPFRIPFAGKVGVCCFDKTGTLTSNDIFMKGLATRHHGSGEPSLIEPLDIPLKPSLALGACQSLFNYKNQIVGDPLEEACLSAMGWQVGKSDFVTKKGVKIQVFTRFPFSSSLKRMTTISMVDVAGAPFGGTLGNRFFMIASKGAPETMKQYLKDVPQDYDELYQYYARQGGRVIAVACRLIPLRLGEGVRSMGRATAEKDLDFCGFVVMEYPLKMDSAFLVEELLRSSHRVVMITGDNALTACQVARDVKIIEKPVAFLRCEEASSSTPHSPSVNAYDLENKFVATVPATSVTSFSEHYSLCMNGETLSALVRGASTLSPAGMQRLLSPYVNACSVFARMSPEEKETVVSILNRAGETTLMCGDGTNDVGALRHAHVGVAILTEEAERAVKEMKEKERDGRGKGRGAGGRGGGRGKGGGNWKERLEQAAEDDGQAPMVQLGDASIASPFTSRSNSVFPVTYILQQGRCTLVTTYQIFRILAVNCLVTAYSLSVLYLDGIKLGDTQATVAGLAVAIFFLFLSRTNPSDQLSEARPPSSLFCMRIVLSILGQCAAHMVALVYSVATAHQIYQKANGERVVDVEGEFEPDTVNTAVYLIMCSTQFITFFVNYQGQPFMESLQENKALFYGLLGACVSVVLLVLAPFEDLNYLLELSPIPFWFRLRLLAVIMGDFVVCWGWEWLVVFIFGK